MRTIRGLWRWRGSPLCRRSDLTEAWIGLWAAALLVLAAPLAGLAAAAAAQTELTGVVREQQAQRHQVWATVEQPVDRPAAGPGGARSEEEHGRHPVLAFWKGPDGVTHSGTVRTVRPLFPGDRFRVWTDVHGDLTSPPLSRADATAYSAVAGVVAGVLAGIAVEGGRRAAVRRLLRKRYAEWDEQWARIGPDWGRAGSNS